MYLHDVTIEFKVSEPEKVIGAGKMIKKMQRYIFAMKNTYIYMRNNFF
jgi:hypothetical protein